jgi:hypothetical protein
MSLLFQVRRAPQTGILSRSDSWKKSDFLGDQGGLAHEPMEPIHRLFRSLQYASDDRRCGDRAVITVGPRQSLQVVNSIASGAAWRWEGGIHYRRGMGTVGGHHRGRTRTANTPRRGAGIPSVWDGFRCGLRGMDLTSSQSKKSKLQKELLDQFLNADAFVI